MKLSAFLAAAAVMGTALIGQKPASAGATMSASYCQASMAVFKYRQYLDGGAPKSFAVREGIYPYHDGTVKCEYEMRATFKNYPAPTVYPNQMDL